MKRGLFFFCLFSLLLSSLSLPRPALANKCGINIGPYYAQVNEVVNLTKQGGWVVAFGTPGNCSEFASLFGKGLNVVIRAYNNGQLFTPEQALGWAATLGKLDTKGQKVFFMPWNEPNEAGESGGQWVTAGKVMQYTKVLKQHLQDAGLLGTKVVLLSPMVNKDSGNFDGFFSDMDPNAFYRFFAGSSINAYDRTTNQNNYQPCQHPEARKNNCHYDQSAIPAPYYALEAGVVGTCRGGGVCYKDNEIKSLLTSWYPVGNFEMFAIFSYDPIRDGEDDDWNLFSASQTTQFYQNNCTAGPIHQITGFDQAVFDSWLNSHQNQLVSCGGCGYAPSIDFCTGAGGGLPPGGLIGTPCDPRKTGMRESRLVECEACNITNKQTSSCATSFTVNDTVSWQKKEGGNICTIEGPEKDKRVVTTTWGGVVEIDPSSITIPFVGLTRHENGQWRDPITGKATEGENTHLADYFDGTNEYYLNYRRYWLDWVNYSGVLRKVTPMLYQDQLKKNMVNRALASLGTPLRNYEGKIHNYRVIYPGRLCWNLPLWASLAEIFFTKTHPVLRFLDQLGIKVANTNAYCLFENSPVETFLITGDPPLLRYPIKFEGIKKMLETFNKISPFKIGYRYVEGTPSFLGVPAEKITLKDFNNHFPPLPTEDDYEKKWLDWKTKPGPGNRWWGYWWASVPMTTREDTEGFIVPYLGTKEGDSFNVKETSKNNQIERVPHVARLYESSKIVNRVFLPFPKSSLLTETPTDNPSLASVEQVAQNEKTEVSSRGAIKEKIKEAVVGKPVLANPPPGCTPTGCSDTNCINPEIIDPYYQGGAIHYKFKACQSCCEVTGGVGHVFAGPCPGMGQDVFIPALPDCLVSDHPGLAPPVPISCPGTATISICLKADNLTPDTNPCKGKQQSAGCTVTVDAQCNITNTTCGSAPPPPPTCFQKPAPAVDACVKDDAISDPYAGDRLCCKKIEVDLQAKDTFENKQYAPCTSTVWACQGFSNHEVYVPLDPCLDFHGNGNGTVVNCDGSTTGWPEPIDTRPGYQNCVQLQRPADDCYTWVGETGDYENVSRQIGLSLYHPYLYEIWKQTAGPKGTFNNFRPFLFPNFPTTPAYSEAVGYKYTDTSDRCTGNAPMDRDCPGANKKRDGNNSPTRGKFYFPFLGGIQQAKQWSINSLKPKIVPLPTP